MLLTQERLRMSKLPKDYQVKTYGTSGDAQAKKMLNRSMLHTSTPTPIEASKHEWLPGTHANQLATNSQSNTPHDTKKVADNE